MSKADEPKRAAGPDAGSAAQDSTGGDGAETIAETAALTAAVDDLRDKYLRAVAETDNVRKRAERDVSEARAYGIAGFARDVIGVADNLTRALEAIDPTARTAAEGTLRALLDGVDLTRRELEKALAKHGVRPLDPTGEKFDPNFHQAMYEIRDADAPAGTVVQVMQTGYAIGNRVLRPALVAVATGGTRERSVSAAQESDEDEGI
jgi:molecular chaperone GrpE